MTDAGPTDLVEARRDAFERRAWSEAYRLLREADADGGLDADELEWLAKSAWWIGRSGESIEARERAYALHLDRGEPGKAAMTALTLRRQYDSKLSHSVAQAWLNRAEHLLEGEPESQAQGYLAIAHGELVAVSDDVRRLTGSEPTSLEELIRRRG